VTAVDWQAASVLLGPATTQPLEEISHFSLAKNMEQFLKATLYLVDAEIWFVHVAGIKGTATELWMVSSRYR
jgi:hypothetical protein